MNPHREANSFSTSPESLRRQKEIENGQHRETSVKTVLALIVVAFLWLVATVVWTFPGFLAVIPGPLLFLLILTLIYKLLVPLRKKACILA